MKKILVLALIATGVAVALAACQPKDESIHGYVEGEFEMISATTGGILEQLDVRRGQQVEAGDALFALDLTQMQAQRAGAAAELARAEALLRDLTKGERPEELEVIEEQRSQAKAELEKAQKEFKRIEPLVKTGVATAKELDTATASLEMAQARYAELEARLQTAKLGAREDQIDAAQASVESARQAIVRIDRQIAEAQPKAARGGMVEDTFYKAGEFVQAGKPVVSLLPPDEVKVRFFVPQAMVPTLEKDQRIRVKCDGREGAIDAEITYIAPEAEYTPPVIYSVESRDKLVFMIEARPLAPEPMLRPGLPVDIEIEPG